MTEEVHEHALALARRYLEVLGGSDADAVADLVSADFVNEHQNALGSGCVGREEYRARLSGFFSSFPSRRYDIAKSAVHAPGDGRVVDVVVRYRFRADVAIGHADDMAISPIDIPGVMWIEVVGEQIVRRVDTWDALTYFIQSGDRPPDSLLRREPGHR